MFLPAAVSVLCATQFAYFWLVTHCANVLSVNPTPTPICTSWSLLSPALPSAGCLSYRALKYSGNLLPSAAQAAAAAARVEYPDGLVRSSRIAIGW